MNKLMKIAAAGALMLLAACGKDDPDPDAKPVLTVTPVKETISFGANAKEEYTFEVATNQPVWLALSDQDWCKVEIDAETSTFKVRAQPNDATVPPPPATITVSAGQSLKMTFTATQAAAKYDIYMVGNLLKEQAEQIACYWKNGERTDLADGTVYSELSSVTASGGSVYMAGSVDSQPSYWKDGVRFALADVHFGTLSIAVDNGSVYVLNRSFYWKDDDPVVEFNDPDFDAKAIAVSGGTVYVAGEVAGEGSVYACCWSDGQFERLVHPGGSLESEAACATASGGSVYIGGLFRDNDYVTRPCYWKDGVHTPLELPEGVNHPYVRAIAVENGKVYAAGDFYNLNTSKDQGCYWVDGKCIPLEVSDDIRTTDIYGIAVAGGKVYLAGKIGTRDGKDHVCYWVDGKPIVLNLTDEFSSVEVKGIALVKK